MFRPALVFQPLLLGGWVLLMPPVPLGTSLPPLSEWTAISVHKTSEECDRKRETVRDEARLTVTKDPNADAMKVATALGKLEARCVEGKTAAPPAAATATPVAPATPAPAAPAKSKR